MFPKQNKFFSSSILLPNKQNVDSLNLNLIVYAVYNLSFHIAFREKMHGRDLKDMSNTSHSLAGSVKC